MSKDYLSRIIPVLFSFFVMSFVDLVGVATDYVKSDFNLSAWIVQFISFSAFLWFFVFSVPAGILQQKYGKRNVLILGILLSAIGMLLPFLFYSFTFVLIGFSLLGIGNTIIQVSANPLLISVVSNEKASSFMSFSQFVKALGSMIAAPLTALLLSGTGNWKLIFLVFAFISLLSIGALFSVKYEDEKEANISITMLSCLKLLTNKFVLLMFLAIFLVVGIDVGMNAGSGQFLIDKYDMTNELASSGRSIYFLGKLIGCFLGAFLLTYFSPKRFLISSGILVVVSILGFAFNPFVSATWLIFFVIGLGVSNIFPLVFTLTVRSMPDRSNEISGLMMMAVSGGAVIPPLMGFIAGLSNYTSGMILLAFCALIITTIGMFNTSGK